MFLHLKNILTPEEVQAARTLLGADAPWIDGRSSAGAQAVQQKNNQHRSTQHQQRIAFASERRAQEGQPQHDRRADGGRGKAR